MKKVLVVVLVVLSLGAAGAFAIPSLDGFAVGGEGSAYVIGSEGLLFSGHVTLQLPKLPVMFSFGVSTRPAFGVTADYWIWHGPAVSIYGWYAGMGGYVALTTVPATDVMLGVRFPVGFQAWLINDMLELYVQVTPAFGLSLIPMAFDWKLQSGLGFRVWL
jgi:hypothetical protein